MTPYEIALRNTRPLSLEEARRDLSDEFAGREVADPTPEMQAEILALIREVEELERQRQG